MFDGWLVALLVGSLDTMSFSWLDGCLDGWLVCRMVVSLDGNSWLLVVWLGVVDPQNKFSMSAL